MSEFTQAQDAPSIAPLASDETDSDIGTRTVRVTFFEDKTAQTLATADMTLPQIADGIATQTAASKLELPWLKLAVFGSKRSENNCLRTNDNVLHVSGIEVEHDKGEISFDDAIATMRKARIRSLLYTSPSYVPETKERWRILVPLSTNHPPETREKMVARINGLFKGKIAPESFVLSQAYLYGHIDGLDHRVEVIDGDFLDVRDDTYAGSIFKDGSGVRDQAANGISNGSGYDFNNAGKQHKSRADDDPGPVNRDKIEAALNVISSDCSYETWLGVAGSLHHALGESGFELFDRWSAKAAAKYNAAECRERWRGARSLKKHTAATIFYLADEADAGWRGRYEEEEVRRILDRMADRHRKAAGAGADEQNKTGEQQSDNSQGEQHQRLIKSSDEFIADFVPPDYLIEGLLQRRFCYSLTAPTGHGKTAVALFLAATTALGQPMGEYPVEQGRVLYLAGENPDDVRMRWLLLADVMNFDHTAIDVHFLAGVFKLTQIGQRIRAEVEEIGPVALVVVDTSAAYFEGDAENDNVQLGNHARLMRSLVTLPGEPTVLVACHPVKNAGADNLLPRGGGAFLAEMDGNLTCWRNDNVVTLHWQGKFRGPDFAPVPFALSTGTTDALKDSKGKKIPTVSATPMSDKERSEAEAKTRRDEDALLIAIAENDRSSMTQLASALHWLTKDHKPYKARVQRAADRLKKGGFVKVERGCLILTDRGKKEASRAQYNADAAGASYG